MKSLKSSYFDAIIRIPLKHVIPSFLLLMYFNKQIFPVTAIVCFLLVFGISACSTSEQAADDTGNGKNGDRIISDDEIVEARSHFIRGITAMHLDDHAAAEAHLTRAHATLRDQAGVNFSLAELYYKMDDPVNSTYYSRQAVSIEPENKWYRLQLADGYHAKGNYEEVINQLDSALVYAPSDTEILYTKAQLQANQGEYEASNETYVRIMEINGPDRSIHYQRISNFTRLDDTDAIIAELKKVLELDQGSINTLLMLSQLYLDEDEPEKARDALEKALERNPRHPEALVNLADIHIKNEEWESAGELLNGLVRDDDISSGNKFEIVQYIMSRFSNEPENEPLFRTTESLIETLLHVEADHGMSHAMAADFYLSSGHEEKALVHLQKTTELMPENESAWRQLVQTYYIAGRYEEAIETGKNADEHVPDDAFIHFFVGGSYFLQEQYEEAAAWLHSASELPSRPPFRSAILGTLGDTYASLDQWDRADEAYEQSIAADPDNDVALNNYAYYLSERNERLEEAREMASRALELNPENSAFLDTMGWVYFKLGDLDNAYKYIRESIETGDASAEVLEHMGDVYDKKGEPDRAHYWWQKALEEDDSREHLKERLHIN